MRLRRNADIIIPAFWRSSGMYYNTGVLVLVGGRPGALCEILKRRDDL